MVKGDGRPGRGRCLAEEDDDEYNSRIDGRGVMSLLHSSVSRSNETRSERISVPLGQHARLTNLQIWPRRLIVVVGAD